MYLTELNILIFAMLAGNAENYLKSQMDETNRWPDSQKLRWMDCHDDLLRQRDRHTDTQTHRQTHRHTHRHTGRKIHR